MAGKIKVVKPPTRKELQEKYPGRFKESKVADLMEIYRSIPKFEPSHEPSPYKEVNVKHLIRTGQTDKLMKLLRQKFNEG